MFHDIETWHPRDFDLRNSARLEPAWSEYAAPEPWNSVRDYVTKRRKISDFVGTDQFLWCIDPTRTKFGPSSQKPIRWRLRMKTTRIIAYVEEQRWEDEIRGRAARPASEIVFRTPISRTIEYALLVAWPLLPDEIIGRDEFTYDPTHFSWSGPICEHFS